MTGFRLDKGGLIERRQKINFRFNGQQVTGFKGDTIGIWPYAGWAQL